MSRKHPYTIGHGNRTISEFLGLLKKYRVDYIIDVRSKPYSKFNPHFNRDELGATLQEHDITYVFMGDNLGGRPADLSCYNIEGKVDYDKVKLKSFFREGIDRIKTAYNKNLSIALMCSESKPGSCHRTKLIGEALSSIGIDLQHIDEKGKLKDQLTVMNELKIGVPEFDLFGASILSSSRKAYL